MFEQPRPTFPKRALITGGMPYGNKELHFGHIGGVFIHADVFTRFLKDRIGAENVIFVSGTDCYGSPIVESHRQMMDSDRSLSEFVKENHARQRKALNDYHIDISLFATSAFGESGKRHNQVGAHIFRTLKANGHLEKRETLQFFDSERNVFLNGRQVVGQCPIQGCQSDKAYADECSLGHQYMPAELLNPKSTLSGTKPELKTISNWYFKLPKFIEELKEWLELANAAAGSRRFAISSMREFFGEPVVYVAKKQHDEYLNMSEELPSHRQEEGQKKSIVLTFESLPEREKATALLSKHGIQYRSGKTLTPFRLSGNIEWGAPIPDESDLTFWVWPESLWAPISFTQTYLASIGEGDESWKEWWCDPESQVYQFIGEDNVYFYGPAEMAMFMGLQGEGFSARPPKGQLQLPELIVNKHLLFLNSKASSSAKVKPPMASDLLQHYSSDQLRAHFCSMGLGMKNISFRPKPYNPAAGEKEADPVLKEGNLLCNVFNRAVRSCFYTIQAKTDGKIPVGTISEGVLSDARQCILRYEQAMYRKHLHQAFTTVDKYIRRINKHWNVEMKRVNEDEGLLRQLLIDTFHMLRVAAGLMHPIAPVGTEKIRLQLNIGPEFWSWDHIFEPIYFFMDDPDSHQPLILPPRTDFFEKPASQYQ